MRKSRIRALLDGLYRLSGGFSALCLIAICLIVVAQVVMRVIDKAVFWFSGDRYGLMIPSAAEFSGFFLAAASFFALAHTLRHGAHIRVNLFIRKAHGGARRLVEIFGLSTGLAVSAFFAWHTALMVIDSWQFHEVSIGIIPVPLWIPQTAMLAGLIILVISFLDDLLVVLGGGEPSYMRHERAEASLAEEIEGEI